MDAKHLHKGKVLGKLYLVTLESFELDESSDKLADVHTVLLKGNVATFVTCYWYWMVLVLNSSVKRTQIKF